MSLPPSYSPNEPRSSITREETWFQGIALSNILFGIQLMLCLLTFVAILRKRGPRHTRMQIILLIYVIVLFMITTASQGLSLDFIQMGFITQRDYPGGPSEFFQNEYSMPVNLAATVLVVWTNWMMETLMVWRCHVVCCTGDHLWWLGVAIPSLLLISVFVTGSIFIHSILHSAPPTSSVLAYGTSSLALNLAATGFIAGRLLVHRHRVVRQFGRGHGHHYVSIAAVVIESAAVYTGFLIVVIISFAIGSPMSNLLQQVIEQVQTITSLLIIWRIARGEGFHKSTDTEVVSAAVSSWQTRVIAQSEQNVDVVQLGVLSGPQPPNDEEDVEARTESRIRQKEGEALQEGMGRSSSSIASTPQTRENGREKEMEKGRVV